MTKTLLTSQSDLNARPLPLGDGFESTLGVLKPRALVPRLLLRALIPQLNQFANPMKNADALVLARRWLNWRLLRGRKSKR